MSKMNSTYKSKEAPATEYGFRVQDGWGEDSGYDCPECGRPLTIGEYKTVGICTGCYFIAIIGE